MAQVFEVGMLLCFGFAWPVSIYKSLQTRSTQGKSLVFLAVIWAGYVCGILAKFAGGNVTYVVAFYALNLLMVSADILLFFRNKRLDMAARDRAGQG